MKGKHKSPQPLASRKSGAAIYTKGGTASTPGGASYRKPVKTSATRMDK